MGNIKKRGKYKKKNKNIDALKVYLNKNIKNGKPIDIINTKRI